MDLGVYKCLSAGAIAGVRIGPEVADIGGSESSVTRVGLGGYECCVAGAFAEAGVGVFAVAAVRAFAGVAVRAFAAVRAFTAVGAFAGAAVGAFAEAAVGAFAGDLGAASKEADRAVRTKGVFGVEPAWLRGDLRTG